MLGTQTLTLASPKITPPFAIESLRIRHIGLGSENTLPFPFFFLLASWEDSLPKSVKCGMVFIPQYGSSHPQPPPLLVSYHCYAFLLPANFACKLFFFFPPRTLPLSPSPRRLKWKVPLLPPSFSISPFLIR